MQRAEMCVVLTIPLELAKQALSTPPFSAFAKPKQLGGSTLQRTNIHWATSQLTNEHAVNIALRCIILGITFARKDVLGRRILAHVEVLAWQAHHARLSSSCGHLRAAVHD